MEVATFLSFDEGVGFLHWSWPKGRLRSEAAATPKSSQSPDGLTCSLGANTSGSAAFPPSFLASHIVFIPKRESVADVRRVKALRPIALMQTSGKTVAAITSEELAQLGSPSAASLPAGTWRTSS